MLVNSGCFVVILAAMMALFSAVVVYFRYKTKIMYGDGGNMTLIRARAAHFNLLENGLPFIILLIGFDLMEGTRNCILIVSWVFIGARVLHAIATYWLKPEHMLRAISYTISHLAQIYLMVKLCMLVCERARAIA